MAYDSLNVKEQVSKTKTRIEWAKWFARQDVPVFPLIPFNKEPLTPRGHHDATRDVAQIDAWAKEYPNCNWGGVPGQAMLVVVDLDLKVNRKGETIDGRIAYGELVPDWERSTFIVRSGSGGNHAYYYSKRAFRDATSLLKGVDIKSPGYMVLPGAEIYLRDACKQIRRDENGKPLIGAYTVTCEKRFAPLPDAVAVQLDERKADRDEKRKRFLTDPDQPEDFEKAMHFLNVTDVSIEYDGGNNWAYKTACCVRDFNISQDECLELMLYHKNKDGQSWNDRCEPPWSPGELAEIVENAYSYATEPFGAKAGHILKDGDTLAKLFAEYGEPDSIDDVAPLPKLPKRGGDTAFAGMFATQKQSIFRCVTEDNRWLKWNGSRLVPCQKGEHEAAMKEYANELRADLAAYLEQVLAGDDESLAERVDGIAKQASALDKSYTRQKTVLASASSEEKLAILSSELDADPWLLGVQNGVLDLRTGQLIKPHISQLISKAAGCAFDPEATCPRWEQFMLEVFDGNAEMVAFMKRWCGYILTGDVREEKFMFAYGEGGNGKGKLVDVLLALLGDYGDTAAFNVFEAGRGERHPTELAVLEGKRLIVASEVPDDSEWNVQRIKQLTGGDDFKARLMRQDMRTIKPSAKIMIAGNKEPILRTVDDAMRRRLLLVPFKVDFIASGKRDYGIRAKLLAELPGILNWCLAGLREFQELAKASDSGLGQPPAAVSEATEEYMADQDSFGRWMAECCVVHPEVSARAKDLWASWQRFSARNGVPLKLLSNNVGFPRKLAKHQFIRKDTKAGAEWLGIGLKTESSEPEG